ncbi:MAG: hypothetical protein OD811_06100 [Alphaproteobacteria bacterium]
MNEKRQVLTIDAHSVRNLYQKFCNIRKFAALTVPPSLIPNPPQPAKPTVNFKANLTAKPTVKSTTK